MRPTPESADALGRAMLDVLDERRAEIEADLAVLAKVERLEANISETAKVAARIEVLRSEHAAEFKAGIDSLSLRPQRHLRRPVQATPKTSNSSDAGALVLDPFMGSGSTLIACERTGRISAGIELDPRYCDVIVARWEAFTELKAEKAHG